MTSILHLSYYDILFLALAFHYLFCYGGRKLKMITDKKPVNGYRTGRFKCVNQTSYSRIVMSDQSYYILWPAHGILQYLGLLFECDNSLEDVGVSRHHIPHWCQVFSVQNTVGCFSTIELCPLSRSDFRFRTPSFCLVDF